MPDNKVRAVFEATASTYDRDRALLIPSFHLFYGWALDLIPQRARTIVDLGAGSGLFTAMIRNRLPDAHIHVVDFSQAMLDLARKRLSGDANVTFHLLDYAAEALPADACAVVSSLSIHHLEDHKKREVYRKACAALKANGVFINAEQVSGPTAALEARYKAVYWQQVRAAGAGEQQIAESLLRQAEDRCAPVEDQLNWLREAGFSDVDCWYKEGRFAVFAGTKSAGSQAA